MSVKHNHPLKGAGTMTPKQQFQETIMMTIAKHTCLGISMAQKFSHMVIGLIEFGSVKTTRLAQGFSGMATSCTRALERFYVNSFIDTTELGAMVYNILSLNGRGPFTIIIDRTNWDFGTKHINIFVASILFGNTTIPILVNVFNKAGSTNFNERKTLIEKLVALLGRENIRVILGDREFIGNEWFQHLYRSKLPFAFRIRNNFYVTLFGKKIRVDLLVANVKRGEIRTHKVMISDISVCLEATRSETGELVIVVASRIQGNILKRYKARWFIELFFKSIKSMGFNLEETHITDSNRIMVLMAAIAIASCLSTQSGFFKHRIKPIRKKKHGRNAFSVFTYGLRFLRCVFQNGIEAFSQELHTFIKQKRVPVGVLVKVFFPFVSGGNYVGY